MLAIEELLLADMEYKLQVANALSNDDSICAGYLLRRRERLLPKLVKKAVAQNDPVDYIVAQFCKAVHERHYAGLSLD